LGAGRADAATLSVAENARGWPLIVRRAKVEDREAVLAFASVTWNGWDYIPNAWPVWLDATDGAFLVAEVDEPVGGVGAGLIDAEGRPLEVGQPVAITRVAMVSDDEAWLEGIRVDPRVRGLGVAADLQVAELHWVVAQRAVIVRYATGGENLGSHKLGARDGINLLARFRDWRWSAAGSAEDDEDDKDDLSAFDPQIREQATARRRTALERLGEAGMIASAERDDADHLWHRLADDPTFAAGHRLFEARSWAMAELTEALFRRHLLRGEVIVGRDPVAGGAWAVAILVGEQLASEDSALRLALLTGDGAVAAALADQIRSVVEQSVRFRVPVDVPMITGHEATFRAAGFTTRDREMHILARAMDADHPIPVADPSRVVLVDPPQRVKPPRW